jgi:hypothetical protein
MAKIVKEYAPSTKVNRYAVEWYAYGQWNRMPQHYRFKWVAARVARDWARGNYCYPARVIDTWED